MKRRPRIYYSASQRALIWDRWRKGETLHQIARLFDRYHSSIHRIVSETGGIRPAERHRSKMALTLIEREEIRWAPPLTKPVGVEIRDSIRPSPPPRPAGARRTLIRVGMGVVGVLISLHLVLFANDPIGYLLLGRLKSDLGDSDGAIAALSRAIELYPNVQDGYTELAWAYNNLAWDLATTEQVEKRDGARAIQWATKACELTHWEEPSTLGTLAAAYARTGDFDAAVKWQQDALQRTSMAGNQRADEMTSEMRSELAELEKRAKERLQIYREGKAWPP